MNIDLRLGNSLDVLKTMEDNSVDSIVTDPPYGLSFMGNKWDYDVPSVEIWRECLRVLKHGGHLLAFSDTRTYHRMVVNIEDAGFEVRDCIQWLYGTGFPKSRNVGDGWGTQLKPANEPICLARKPLIGTVAENVLKHGTGAMNIDGCRVGDIVQDTSKNGRSADKHKNTVYKSGLKKDFEGQITVGRWPANVIFDEEVAQTLEESRFFYCAKASKKERNAGVDNNNHPTVKPIDLMRYLCRLITPPEGTVLDPFMGSGTTGIAVCLEGFNFVGIELDESYLEIARNRISHWGDYEITETEWV